MTSAWTSDDRPHQPCVVCFAPPDRTVELPDLPDVHVAFASSTLCRACADLAAAADTDALTSRAADGWADDPDVVPTVVRLVLAWAGHADPAALPATQVGRPTRPVLSDADRRVWRRLEPLIHDGPAVDVTVHGRIVHESGEGSAAFAAWRDGPRVRLVEADGEEWLIGDGVTVWRRGPDGMVAEPRDGDTWAGRGTELAGRRSREDVELFGFGDPVGPIEPVTYLGRPAWGFRFAAPSHKPFDMQVVVDDETGLILEKRFGERSVSRWTEFRTGEPLPGSLFTWAGPTVDLADIRRAEESEHEDDLRQRAQWFAAHVTAAPLLVDARPVEVMLHQWSDDGSFEASVDGPVDASVARRRRSTDWWALGWSEVTDRWSDDTWDWALAVWDFDGRADPRHAGQLRAWLGAAGSGRSVG